MVGRFRSDQAGFDARIEVDCHRGIGPVRFLEHKKRDPGQEGSWVPTENLSQRLFQ